MTIQLSSLRVSADLDPGGFVRGANEMAAAQQQLLGGNRALSASQTDVAAKVSDNSGLNRLLRTYVQGVAEVTKFENGTRTLSRALETGKLGINEYNMALSSMQQRLGISAEATALFVRGQNEAGRALALTQARMASNTNARGGANQNDRGANNFAAFNSGQQLQDILVTASMGQSIGTIAMQQGLQLGTAWQMSLGEKGTTGVVKALAGGLTSLVSPLNIAAIGFTAVVAAGIQFGSKLLPQVKSLDEAIKAQQKSVTELGNAYGIAGIKADDFGKKSVIASEAEARRDTAALKLSADVAAKSIQNQLGSPYTVGRGRETFFGVRPEFSQFGEAISILNGQIRAGRPDYDAFEKSIAAVVQQNPGLQTTGDKILAIVAAAAEAAKQLSKTADIIKDINRGSVGGPGAMDRAQEAGREQLERLRRMGVDPFASIRIDPAADQAGIAQRREAAAAQLQSLAAISPIEKEAAARAEAAAQYIKGESDIARADRIDLAGKIALAQATKGLSDAQRERGRSLDQTLASAKLDVDLIGRTVGETARLRLEFDQIAQVRAEAARNGIAADESEIARIKEKAAELQKIVDLQTRLNLNRDLNFERDQLFRSPQEQQVASRLRGTGIGMDSPQAQMMRQNIQLGDLQTASQAFVSTFASTLQSSGGDIGKSFGAALLAGLQGYEQKAIEQLGNILFKLLSSGLGLGGAPGMPAIATAGAAIAGSVLGGANDNYAPGAVTRSPLAAVGGMSQYARAIRSIESDGSGGYSALGPVLKNGDQALGAYQVMRSNLPSWSREALGHPLSQSQFMSDPAAQDAIFQKQFGSYLTRYGNPQDAASAWFTGGPQSTGAGARDVLGTTGSGYVEKFNAALGKLSTTATDTAKSLAGGLGHLGQSLSQFPAAPAMPGGGGGGGLFSSLFSMFGGSSPRAMADIASGSWGLFADGTDNAPEGWAWVGERGPELKKLRAGDVIRSNPRSMGMVGNNGNGGPRGGDGVQYASRQKVELHVHVDGANGDEHVRMLSKQGAQEAIGEYHQAQSHGGFGELQKQYVSQKG